MTQFPAPTLAPVVPLPTPGYSTVTYRLDQLRRQQLANHRIMEMAKSPAVAYVLWLFFGVVGVHRFYLRSTGIALGQLVTLGGLGFWSLIDVFFIGRRVRTVNHEMRCQVYAAYGVPHA